MGNFGLSLEEEKSRLIEFGRFAQKNAQRRGTKAATFDFLGFTHYCSKSRDGRFRVKRKTSRKKFRKKLKEVRAYIKANRDMSVKAMIAKINQILIGYYHYYGITDNSKSLENFRHQVRRSLFYWINRRSQKRSYTWEGFTEMLKVYPIAPPRIYVSVYA